MVVAVDAPRMVALAEGRAMGGAESTGTEEERKRVLSGKHYRRLLLRQYRAAVVLIASQHALDLFLCVNLSVPPVVAYSVLRFTHEMAWYIFIRTNNVCPCCTFIPIIKFITDFDLASRKTL